MLGLSVNSVRLRSGGIETNFLNKLLALIVVVRIVERLLQHQARRADIVPLFVAMLIVESPASVKFVASFTLIRVGATFIVAKHAWGKIEKGELKEYVNSAPSLLSANQQ